MDLRRVASHRAVDPVLAAFAYILACGLRLPLRSAPYYGDEGMLYYVSRHFWSVPANVQDVYLPYYYHFGFIFFQRPVYYLTYAPAAHLSFDAFRLFHITLSSLLPVALFYLLRGHGVRRVLAFAAALVTATYPFFVSFGAIALMDTYGVLLFVGGLALRAHGRPVLAGLALLASVGAKETAWFGVVFVLSLDLWTHRARGGRLFPMRASPLATTLLYGLPFVLLPLSVALSHGLVPGAHATVIRPDAMIDGLTLAPWLALLAALGLLDRRTRRLALEGLFFPVFLFLTHVVAHRSVEAWYTILPCTLTLAAATLTLDEACDRARRHVLPVRWGVPATALAVAGLLLSTPIVAASETKTRILHPFYGEPVPSLAEVYRQEAGRDPDYWDAIRYLEGRPGRPAVLVDIIEPMFLYPLADEGRQLTTGFTEPSVKFQQDPRPWAVAVESGGSLTLLYKYDTRLNHAIRDTYADCGVYDNPLYAIYEGEGCPGRAEQLAAALAARTS